MKVSKKSEGNVCTQETIEQIKDIKKLASLRHSKNVNHLLNDKLTLGERIADKVATFAGSWTFILSFIFVLVLWITFNSIQFFSKPFDAFPFILLNLILSCIAALQAPVIMMSQNRQETKDRIRAEHDYEINLKAEILIEEVINRLQKLEDNQQKILQALEDKEEK